MTNQLTSTLRWILRYSTAVAMILFSIVYAIVYFLPGDEAGSGFSSGYPEESASGRVVWITTDDAFRAHVNGRPAAERTSWYPASPIALPDEDPILIAVEATNYGGPGALIGAWFNGPKTVPLPAKWVCHEGKELGWYMPEYNDGRWAPPVELGAFGVHPWGTIAGPALRNSAWVWTQPQADGNQTIYCRWWISVKDAPVTIAEGPVDGASEAADQPSASAASLAEPPVEEASLPQVLLTADDVIRVYLDGNLVRLASSWAAPIRLGIKNSAAGSVIGVEVTNHGAQGGLLGVWLGSGAADEVKPASWLCSKSPAENWNHVGFDAQGWTAPEVIAPYGSAPWGRLEGLELPGAGWVWTQPQANEKEIIYCRWTIPPS